MIFILVCLDVIHHLMVPAGYASPGRRAAVIVLSGCYLAAVGWWAGGRILTAWRGRDRDRTAGEDQLG